MAEKEKPAWAEPPDEEEKIVVEQKGENPNAPFFKKLDAIIEAINGLSHQFCRIADKMTGTTMTIEPSKKVVEKSPVPRPSPPAETSTVMNLFPSDLRNKLTFSEPEGDIITVKPKEYLGSQNFAKIAAIAKDAGGKYVSAGKESHFDVPLTKKVESEAGELGGWVRDLFPPVLQDLLKFEETPEIVIVRARQYLGSDNFAKIAAIVREAGGQYISEGKNSRFEVSKRRG